MDLTEGPNLIGDNVIKALNVTMETKEPSMTISDKVFQFGGYVFNTFIRENLLWIILIICFALFLSYRYYRKQRAEQARIMNASLEKYEPVIVEKNYTVYDDLVSDVDNVNALNSLPVSNPTLGNQPQERYYYNRYTPPYNNYTESPMVNPYGFPTNFNDTTGTFIDYSTMMNNEHECLPPYAV